ncbi:MAG: helix-hairpin-helix domain-containing protein [Bacillota bacterium]|nr:helix-hairpin-helix domain-containing protein [Bacillota bacterium]
MARMRLSRRLLLLLVGSSVLLLVGLVSLMTLGSPAGGSWLWSPAALEETTSDLLTATAGEGSEPSEAAASVSRSVRPASEPEPGTETSSFITVHLTGSVCVPGVYRLPPGALLLDAVTAAGGLMEEAAAEHVNLAALVLDHSLIRIPSRKEMARITPPFYAIAAEPIGTTSATAAAAADPTDGAEGAVVNINTADQGLLETLPGVGPQIARAILRQREQLGGFQSVEDLLLVPGIGERRLEALRPMVTVGP